MNWGMFMKKVLLFILLVVIFIGTYGFFINSNGFKVKEDTILVDNLSTSFEGFKILQLSDLKINNNEDIKRLKKIVKSINEAEADIFIFTGDLLGSDLSNKDIEVITNELKNINVTMYKYAVIGDKDDRSTYLNILDNANIKVLDNESTYLFYKDIKPIKISGLTNLDNVDKALEMVDNYDTVLNIVLTHYPDYINNLLNKDIDIIFAGHSLKGQIRIPFYGGLIKKDWAKTYIDNYYEIDDKRLYVSGGIGTEKVKFRLFNKPEINLYTLKNRT